MKAFIIIALIIVVNICHSFALPVQLTGNQLEIPPPRIIRPCCSFGFDVKLAAIPFVKFTDITSIESLGHHHYLGNNAEQNGIIYTIRGGFIDIGHLRDMADWTAYLYSLIQNKKEIGCIAQNLGHEGGGKKLSISVPENFSDDDILTLASRIAYDLSVWHEIATWFGASTLPMIPERYSSFSVEDCYSNLLGVMLATEAIKSDMAFEDAMTGLITTKLTEIGAVQTYNGTVDAMEAVHNVWWTRKKPLPSANVLVIRHTKVYNKVVPLLVPDLTDSLQTALILEVPENNSCGQSLSEFYELNITLNYKFPYNKLFKAQGGRTISQLDFDKLISRVELECHFKNLKKAKADKKEIAITRKALKGKALNNNNING